MKALFKSTLIAFLSVSAASCVDMKEAPEQQMGQKLVFTATREGVDQGTRSIKMNDGSVWWEPNEEIGVYYTENPGEHYDYGTFTSTNSEPAQTAQFEGTVAYYDFHNQWNADPCDHWAIYPASIVLKPYGNYIDEAVSLHLPSGQVAVEGNFSGNHFPAIARSSTLNLSFWNICGGLKFSVSRDDILSVKFKGNNEEVLAGKVDIGFNTDGKPEVANALAGESDITLVAPDGNPFKPGVFYYMTLLPASLENGFTMTFYTATETGILVSTKPQTVKRSVFGVLKEVDTAVSVWGTAEPEAIDLGLSVKWATFNVGAGKPEEYGDYFAWGETEPYYMPGYALFENPAWKPGKEKGYSYYSYKWLDIATLTLLKYNTDGRYGPIDYKCILDPEDDAATANWGGDWRMPTLTEISELMDNCNWEYTEVNGVSGYKVSGKKQGYQDKSIFLPSAGYRDGTVFRDNSYGIYWSSSLYGPGIAYANNFSSNFVYKDPFACYEGKSIRPVLGQLIKAQSLTIDQAGLELKNGERTQLTATVMPENTTEKIVYWVSSDDAVVSVDKAGFVTANKEGSATITAFSDGVTASCEVIVAGMAIPEAVDLGLSVKWASFNLLAAQPEGRGSFFKWGETEPNDDQYWTTYKWCNGDEYSLIKYSSDGTYGSIIDYLTTLSPEDDAATAILGGDWRMPTRSEIVELLENCNWEEIELNGVQGYKVSGKRDGFQDKWIFICEEAYWSASVGFPANTPAASSASINHSNIWYYFYSEGFEREEALYNILHNYDRPNHAVIRPVYGQRIPVESIEMEDVSVKLGDRVKLSATITPANASESTVWFELDNPDIGYIDSNGYLNAGSGVGVTTIIANNNGVTTTCKLTVSKPDNWSVVGTNGDWDTDIVATCQGDRYTVHVVLGSATSFKWRLNRSWDVNYGGVFVNFNEPFAAVFDGPNIAIPAGEYDIVLNLINPDTPTITVYGEPVQTETVRVYVRVADDAGWAEDRYFYAWYEDPIIQILGSWPGVQSTSTETVNGVTWTYRDIDVTGPFYFITNDGNGLQTVDLEVASISTGKVFVEVLNDTQYGNYSANVTYTSPY